MSSSLFFVFFSLIDIWFVVTIDFEVACENGYPQAEDAIEPLLSITIKNHQNKQI